MTESVTVIGVDGRHGGDISQYRPVQERALIRLGNDHDRYGRHGEDAAPPIHGGPGGLLVVELSESVSNDSYIHAVVTRWDSWQQPVPAAEVPPGRNILLSSTGGKGADGNEGGDGQSGLPGKDGVSATRETDATDGTNGGNGGNAGNGTDGGDGGPGGQIRVLLASHNTHLLIALRWNVDGGDGGPPGQHGSPGKGGPGGAGGSEIKWEQHIGWKYYCTPNCVGKEVGSPSASADTLIRVNTALARTGAQLRTALGHELVRGGGSQAAVAAIAERYNARPHRRVDAGRCRCAGGLGNCPGCDSMPIIKTLKRNPGQPGDQGRDGMSLRRPLNGGLPGPPGLITFVVQNLDGTTSEYREPWKLQLVSFDLEDENGDGIFEPGEHVIVRRVRISNKGGMPSPQGRIQLRIKPSTYFVPDSDAQLIIPPSVAPNSTVTLEGFLRARIRHPTSVINSKNPYGISGVELSMFATVHWLDRRLPDFDVRKTFDIRYPCAFTSTELLASVSPGSSSSLTWEVTNYGQKSIGGDADMPREVQIQAWVPSDHGVLSARHTPKASEITLLMPLIEANASTSLSLTIGIPPAVEAPLRIDVTLGLYISDASYAPAEGEQADPELILIQTLQLPLQVSEAYVYHPSSDILMVVNSETPPERVVALREFIWDDLGMTADCWDIDLNGGLHICEIDDSREHVFAKYDRKAVLLSGETFKFLSTDTRTATQLCDPRELHRAMAAGTSFLALSLGSVDSCTSLFKHAVFDIPDQYGATNEDVPNSARFPDADTLAQALQQQAQVGRDSVAKFVLPIRRRWYHILGPRVNSQARQAARRLEGKLPQTRCVIATPAPSLVRSRSNENAGELLVLLGAERSSKLRAVEKSTSRTEPVGRLEKYMIVASLTATQKARLVWSDATAETEEFSFVMESAICSLATDCVEDITTCAPSAFGTGSLDLPDAKSRAAKEHLQIHLPTIGAVLGQAEDSAQVPRAVASVLAYCIAACRPQMKRQVLTEICVPKGPCRKRLRKHLECIVETTLQANPAGQESVDAVRRQADELSTRKDGDAKDIYGCIIKRAAALTGISEYGFTHATTSARDLVPTSELCSSSEWDAKFAAIATMAATILELEQRARAILLRKLSVGTEDLTLPVDAPTVAESSRDAMGSMPHAPSEAASLQSWENSDEGDLQAA